MSTDQSIGNLVAYIKADGAQFKSVIESTKQQLGGFEKSINKFADSMTKIGNDFMKVGKDVGIVAAAMTAGIIEAAREFTSAGNELYKMNLRTDISIENLGKMNFALAKSGLTLQDFSMGLKFLQVNMASAAAGNEADIKTFQELGVSLEQLRAMNPQEQFLAIADRIKAIQDPTLRTAETMKIFGRSAMELMPFIMQGSAGIRGSMAEAGRMGFGMSAEDVKLARELNAEYIVMKKALGEVNEQIGAAAAPTLIKYLKSITDNLIELKNFVQEHKDLFAILVPIATALSIISGVLISISIGATAVAKAIAGFKIVSAAVIAVKAFVAGLGVAVFACGLLSLGVLMLIDSLSNLFGGINFGVMDMILNIRIGGLKIKTYLATAWYGIGYAWDTVKDWILDSWEGLTYGIEVFGGIIYRGMLGILKGIGDGYFSMINWIVKNIKLVGDKAADIIEKIPWLGKTVAVELRGALVYSQDFTKAIGTNISDDFQGLINASTDRMSKKYVEMGERVNKRRTETEQYWKDRRELLNKDIAADVLDRENDKIAEAIKVPEKEAAKDVAKMTVKDATIMSVAMAAMFPALATGAAAALAGALGIAAILSIDQDKLARENIETTYAKALAEGNKALELRMAQEQEARDEADKFRNKNMNIPEMNIENMNMPEIGTEPPNITMPESSANKAVGEFKEMNLARFSLAVPAGMTGGKAQEVKATGVEQRLDKTNELLGRKMVATLG